MPRGRRRRALPCISIWTRSAVISAATPWRIRETRLVREWSQQQLAEAAVGLETALRTARPSRSHENSCGHRANGRSRTPLTCGNTPIQSLKRNDHAAFRRSLVVAE
jgi:hypothetical protein